MNKQRLKQFAEKIGAKVWTDSEEQEIDPDKPIEVPNRRDKRRAKQYSTPSGTGGVHDLLRLGSRPGRAKGATGQPLWFRQMKFEAARRKSLEKVTMDRLEPAVGRIALDLYHAGYETVWDVTEVENINEFLKHDLCEYCAGTGKTLDSQPGEAPYYGEDCQHCSGKDQHGQPEVGIRVKDLAKLRAYLVQQRVPVKWEV